MNPLKRSITDSFYMIRNTRAISITAMLIALSVALHFFTVQLTELLQLRFSFIPVAAAGMLFGPVVGAAAGLVSDILKFIVRPTGPFHAGFTFNELLMGFTYGLIFFRKELTLTRAALAEAAVSLLVHILLTSVWLRDLYAQGMLGILPVRIIKTAILMPVNTALLLTAGKALRRAGGFIPTRLGRL